MSNAFRKGPQHSAPFRRVAAIVYRLGQATLDDVAPHLPDLDRYQVRRALENAAYAGLLTSSGPRWQKGRNGRIGSIYTPAGDYEPPAYAMSDEELWRPITPKGPQIAYPSVFDYGSGRSVTLTWGNSDAAQAAR